MLIDKAKFEIVEKTLTDQGKIETFEQECGEIVGRMMITTDAIPDDIAEEIEIKDDLTMFTASFDFYDMTVSAAVYTKSKGIAKMWITPQDDNAEQPAREWISFFIEKLFAGIDNEGNYGVPMCSFVTDTSDMTVVPSM